MRVERAHPTRSAPSTIVDGGATFESLATSTDPLGLSILEVHFPAGARTRWHAHERGQVLIVTQGHGWVQRLGEDPVAIRAGDVVHVEAGEEHWHGAGDDTRMSHIAIQSPADTAGAQA